MYRLLDEQSLLCSQLRVFLPGTTPPSLSPASNRTVATQCCLLLPPTDVQSGLQTFTSWIRDGLICEGMDFCKVTEENSQLTLNYNRSETSGGWEVSHLLLCASFNTSIGGQRFHPLIFQVYKKIIRRTLWNGNWQGQFESHDDWT